MDNIDPAYKIKVSKRIYISAKSDTEYISWVIRDLNALQSGILIRPATGMFKTTNGAIDAEFFFKQAADIDLIDLEITVSDDMGCSRTSPIDLDSPCTADLRAMTFMNPNDGTFTVNVKNNNGKYGNFLNPVYDHKMISVTPTSSGTVSVNDVTYLVAYKPGVTPQKTMISFSFEESDTGCDAHTDVWISPTKPFIQREDITLGCVLTETGYERSTTHSFSAITNTDWSTFEVNTNDLIINQLGQTSAFRIIADPNLSSGAKMYMWRVANQYGVYSDWAPLEVYVPNCVGMTEPEDSNMPQNIIYNYVKDEIDTQYAYIIPVPENTEIEFDILSGQSPATAPSVGVDDPSGNVRVDREGNIVFTPESNPPGTYAIFHYRWVHEDGSKSPGVFAVFGLFISSAPTVPQPVPNVLGVCGQEVDIYDLSVINDADLSTLEFRHKPGNNVLGSIGLRGNMLTYRANPDTAGSTLIEIRVANWDNIFTNWITIPLQVICAGQGKEAVHCDLTATFDLTSLLSVPHSSTRGHWMMNKNNPSTTATKQGQPNLILNDYEFEISDPANAFSGFDAEGEYRVMYVIEDNGNPVDRAYFTVNAIDESLGTPSNLSDSPPGTIFNLFVPISNNLIGKPVNAVINTLMGGNWVTIDTADIVPGQNQAQIHVRWDSANAGLGAYQIKVEVFGACQKHTTQAAFNII